MKKLEQVQRGELVARGDAKDDARREIEAIYHEVVGKLPATTPPGDDEDDVFYAGPGDILCSPEDPYDQAVVLLREGDRLFLAPIVADASAPGPLDLDAPETDQHEALRVQCGLGGWIGVADASRLDLAASIDDRQLCEARRRVILHAAALDPSELVDSAAVTMGASAPKPAVTMGASAPKPAVTMGASAPKPAVTMGASAPKPAVTMGASAPKPPARAPMGIAIDAERGPLGLWVAAQLDADRSLSSLAMRWAGTSVGRDLLAAARALPGGAAREPALLDGIFDGVALALTRIVAVPGATFDDIWVIFEALEETAAVVVAGPPALGERFAARVAAMVAASASPLIQGGLTWSVNELLERGPASAALAIRIARALLVEPPSLVCDVMHILTTLRRPLREAIAVSGLSETLASRAVASRTYLSDAAAAVEQIDALIASTGGGAGDQPLDLGAVLAPFSPLLAKVHAGAREPAQGMLAMATIKRPLSHLSRAIRHRPEREALITGVCDAFSTPLAVRGACTAFLVVEALEAVRDAYPEETAAMMADRLVQVQPEVACGFGVCIVEGIEKELGADPARRPPHFVVHEDPGGARRCEFEDAEPPSAFGDFGRRSLQAAEAYEDVAGVWTWCQSRLRGH